MRDDDPDLQPDTDLGSWLLEGLGPERLASQRHESESWRGERRLAQCRGVSPRSAVEMTYFVGRTEVLAQSTL